MALPAPLKKYPVPEDFRSLLHDFAREVLRDQPSNLNEYGFLYFKSLEEGTDFTYRDRKVKPTPKSGQRRPVAKPKEADNKPAPPAADGRLDRDRLNQHEKEHTPNKENHLLKNE